MLYTAPSAGGFIGEVVVRDGKWARNWTVNTAYLVGDIVTPTTDNGKYFECTTAGTSHATTEPTWDTVTGHTTPDNTVVWTTRTASALFKTYGAISA